MITALVITFIYVTILTLIMKRSGVKYTDILDNERTFLRGLLIPVAISTTLLTVYAWLAGWLPRVFVDEQPIDDMWLLIIPAGLLATIVWRLFHGNWNKYGRRGLIYLIIGTLLVGFSEELLMRGIFVQALQDDGYAAIIVALMSSIVFGVIHGTNALNGQAIKLTIQQIILTAIYGVMMYMILRVTGTLWAPILFHFLYDLSLMLVMTTMNKTDGRKGRATFIDYAPLVLYGLSFIGLFFIS